MATQRMRGLVLAGVLLLVLGGFSVVQAMNSHQYQSTFNILPGKYLKILANLRDQTRIEGTFTEASGRPVDFTIFSSVQFSYYQAGAATGNLYQINDRPSASVDFTWTVPDTYYPVFSHGTGYLNVTETITFVRTYASTDPVSLAFSGVLFALGAVELVWGIRSGRATRPAMARAAAPSYPPPPPP